MENNQVISNVLAETNGYRDLDQPVILASGELGIFYINTEKLVQDGGKFNEFGDDAAGMINHALAMQDEHLSFKAVISELAEYVRDLFPEGWGKVGVSGGQRRDWLFSGPVAERLAIPHVSLYKQEPGKPERVELMVGNDVEANPDLSNMYIVHVADLLTKGSSCYRETDGVALGWVPMLRQRGAQVNDLVSVVSRLQGGEEMLAAQAVKAHSMVYIDAKFLREKSSDPERAIGYTKNDRAWGEAYLREHGALALLPAFDPAGKLDKARAFLGNFRGVLEESGRLAELETALKEQYNTSLSDY